MNFGRILSLFSSLFLVQQIPFKTDSFSKQLLYYIWQIYICTAHHEDTMVSALDLLFSTFLESDGVAVGDGGLPLCHPIPTTRAPDLHDRQCQYHLKNQPSSKGLLTKAAVQMYELPSQVTFLTGIPTGDIVS
jgi:hypothetical protein